MFLGVEHWSDPDFHVGEGVGMGDVMRRLLCRIPDAFANGRGILAFVYFFRHAELKVLPSVPRRLPDHLR